MGRNGYNGMLGASLGIANIHDYTEPSSQPLDSPPWCACAKQGKEPTYFPLRLSAAARIHIDVASRPRRTSAIRSTADPVHAVRNIHPTHKRRSGKEGDRGPPNEHVHN